MTTLLRSPLMPETRSEPTAHGARTATEIFVGCSERSGSTVLARELAAGLGLAHIPEAFFLHELLSSPTGALRSLWRLQTWGLDPSNVPTDERPEAIAEWFRGRVRAHAGRNGDDTNVGFVEHTPASLDHFDRIREAFGPDVRLVHLIRDGRAVCNSWLSADFGPATPELAADRWSRDIAVGMLLQQRFPGRVTSARFEDLVSDRDATVNRILRDLDLEAVEGAALPAALDPYFEGTHRLLAEPLQADRTDAWRHELAPRVRERFEARAHPVLTACGYDVAGTAQIRRSPVLDVTSPAREAVGQIAKGSRRLARQVQRRRSS